MGGRAYQAGRLDVASLSGCSNRMKYLQGNATWETWTQNIVRQLSQSLEDIYILTATLNASVPDDAQDLTTGQHALFFLIDLLFVFANQAFTTDSRERKKRREKKRRRQKHTSAARSKYNERSTERNPPACIKPSNDAHTF